MIARCQWCRQPKNKCTCRHMPFVLPHHVKYPQGPYRAVNVKRAIGLEFEISEWYNLNDVLYDKYSNLKRVLNLRRVFDRSVEPSHYELTAGPIAGDAILEYLPQLLSIFAETEAEVNQSCSLHVHVDARDVYAWGIRSFLLLYTQWEKDFNRLFPVKRIFDPYANHGGFAKPLPINIRTAIQRMKDATTTHTIKSLLAFGVYDILNLQHHSRRYVDNKATRYIGVRYYGCNIHSYLSRGTIEFRQHEGALDNEAILWALFAAAFVDLTTKPESYSRFRKLSLKEFVERYFSEPLVKWFNERTHKFSGEWGTFENARRRRAATR